MNSQEFAKKLGIKGMSKKKVEEIMPFIDEAIEDLNTWMLAKSNAQKDMKTMGIESDRIGKRYVGNHPITKERIYK